MSERYHELMQKLKETEQQLLSTQQELVGARAQLASLKTSLQLVISTEPSDAVLLAHQTLPTVSEDEEPKQVDLAMSGWLQREEECKPTPDDSNETADA